MSFLRLLIKKRDFEEKTNISNSYFSLFIMVNFKHILKIQNIMTPAMYPSPHHSCSFTSVYSSPLEVVIYRVFFFYIKFVYIEIHTYEFG